MLYEVQPRARCERRRNAGHDVGLGGAAGKIGAPAVRRERHGEPGARVPEHALGGSLQGPAYAGPTTLSRTMTASSTPESQETATSERMIQIIRHKPFPLFDKPTGSRVCSNGRPSKRCLLQRI
jgi:hypothetical protein